MNSFIQDVRLGLRMLRHSPGTSLAAIFALALGIGANTAIFSLVNTLVLRPLPYEKPEGIVLLAYFLNETSPANFLDWRNQNTVFENVAAMRPWNANLTDTSDPERLRGVNVSPGLFPLLGVKAALGRTFLPEEEQAGRDNVVLISHGLWQRRFASDPDIVGKTIKLNSSAAMIVGVMPQGFQFYRHADIWSPLAFTSQEAGRRNLGNLIVVGRLKPSVSMEQAQSDMTGIARRLEQQYPETNTGAKIKLVGLHEYLMGPMRPALGMLVAAVLFVLLIACANIANLLLARAAGRQKEVAIRLAFGAGRRRIIRQLLTESALLGVFGGAAGLLLAAWGVRLLAASIPQTGTHPLSRVTDISIDGRVLAFTFIISLLTSLLFGLAPALQISKHVNLNDALKENGRGTSGSKRGGRLRSLLVVSEVALSLVLLISAGLMIRSFVNLSNVKLGFNPDNALSMQVSLPQSKYADDKRVGAFYQQTLEQLRALPGVQFAGATSNLPLGGNNKVRSFDIEQRQTQNPASDSIAANYHVVSPDYFRSLEIALLKGRYFSDRDTETAPGVAIINESMARRYFPNQDPVGKRLRRGNPPDQPSLPWLEIVGVTADVRHLGLSAPPAPEVYLPYQQNPTRDMTLILRANSDQAGLAAAARSSILRIDPDQPVYNVSTMEQAVSNASYMNRFSVYLLSIFAAVALALASVGIYSVISYSVVQRSHEISIRVALGARPRDIVRMVLKQGMLLTFIGIVIGLFIAFGAMRFLVSLIYGVSSTDLTTFSVTALALMLVALVASLLPALRATRVDPMTALKGSV